MPTVSTASTSAASGAGSVASAGVARHILSFRTNSIIRIIRGR
jgi:hypothetical protein